MNRLGGNWLKPKDFASISNYLNAKKGDLSAVINYRGISLMSIAAKLYNKMILNHIVPFVEPILRKNQNGFKRGRSILSQILCLRRLIEESKLSNRDLALVFVDFSKAYDSVDRGKIFEILKLYGIPDKSSLPSKSYIQTLHQPS